MNIIFASIGTGMTIGVSIFSVMRLAKDGRHAKVYASSNVKLLVPASILMIMGLFL